MPRPELTSTVSAVMAQSIVDRDQVRRARTRRALPWDVRDAGACAKKGHVPGAGLQIVGSGLASSTAAIPGVRAVIRFQIRAGRESCHLDFTPSRRS